MRSPLRIELEALMPATCATRQGRPEAGGGREVSLGPLAGNGAEGRAALDRASRRDGERVGG
jgi:hypothetical protein